MSITITVGTWLIPFIITIVSFILGWLLSSDYDPDAGYGSAGVGLFDLIIYQLAGIISLFSWLIWALF